MLILGFLAVLGLELISKSCTALSLTKPCHKQHQSDQMLPGEVVQLKGKLSALVWPFLSPARTVLTGKKSYSTLEL